MNGRTATCQLFQYCLPSALWLLPVTLLPNLPVRANPVSVAIAPTTAPQALTLYQPIQNLHWEGQLVSNTGIAYFSTEELTNQAVSESDVEPARLSGDRSKLARILTQLGLAQHQQGDYDRAIEYYKQALAIAKDLSDDTLEGVLLGNLGLAYVQKGEYSADAFDYLQAHWEFGHDHGDRRLEAQALGNLATAYYGADLYVKAIELHQKRRELARQLGDRLGEATAIGGIGIVYQALGNSTQAIVNYQQQRSLAQQAHDTRIELAALGNLGIAYQAVRDLPHAIEFQQQRLALARQSRDLRAQAEALANLAGVYYTQGEFAKAIDLYEQGWKLAWEQIHDPAILYKIRGNQALVYLQMGAPDKALELINQYYHYAVSRNDRRAEGVAKNNAAIVRVQTGKLDAAAKTLREGIERLESLRSRLGSNDANKVDIFETQNAPYENLQAVLVAQNQPSQALEIAERGRARAFVELLSRRAASPKQAGTIAPPTLAQIQQIAKTQNATLVEYSILSTTVLLQGTLQTREAELLIWVVQPSGTVTLRRVDLKPLWQQNLSLQALVVSSRAAIGVRGLGVVSSGTTRGATPQRFQQLHRLLIAPIADLLPTNPDDRVIFIPQRALFLVPFAALQDTNGNYLIEQHTIQIAPSIQVLDLTHQQRQRATGQGALVVGLPRGLVVGNPTMPKFGPVGEPPQPLPPLPGAEAEANAIAPLLNTQALTGSRATKAAIVQQMPQVRFIHLATHGILDDVRGLGSAIALAPADSDNGLLSAEDILNLKLNAELVVVSACESGRGRITGDGVIGLSRAFIAAGTPSVIVSLWSIPDAPTAVLMTEFYRQLQQHANKAQALRLAMLATLKQHPNPADWAAFVLIGES